jgi:glycyl-tRNA synthetase
MFREEKYIPSVIKPSFRKGRVLYATFEHSFKISDKKRTYLSLSSKIAPFKCSILTVENSPEFSPIVEKLSFILILGMN